MTNEQEPVLAKETVLRRIHPKHYNPSLPMPIIRTAFHPTPKDEKGLSVYRERFVSPAKVALRETDHSQYGAARLVVGEINSLGLTVIPDPTPDDLPGHSLIPELTTYNAEEKKSKELQRALAELASKNIVLPPEPGT